MNMAHKYACKEETHTQGVKINTSMKFHMASNHGDTMQGLPSLVASVCFMVTRLSFSSGLLQ